MADSDVKQENCPDDLRVAMKELWKLHWEVEQRMDKRHEETAREINDLKLSVKDLRLSVKETSDTVHETSKNLSEQIDKWVGRFGTNMDKHYAELTESLNKWIGHFGTNIGTLVELTLLPGIRKKMTEFGHEFDSLAPRKQYYRKDGKMLAEVDLFLENGVEVMAVEVKTQFNKPEVEYHENRLKLLRKHDAERLKDKAILGAIAGLSIDKDAEELASQLGMYVIKMVEDDKNITVIEPTGKIGKW